MFSLRSSQINYPPCVKFQHTIDLILGEALPNLPHYRMSPTQHDEMTRQVDEILQKIFVSEIA